MSGGTQSGGGSQVDDALLHRMAAAFVDEVNLDQIIPFGSHARGDARADSDFDLVVVGAEPFRPDRTPRIEAVWLYWALADFPVAVDILVDSRDDVESRRNSLNYVLARALRGGKVLYARP